MKKAGKIILLIIIGLIVVGTFVFLWKKSHPEGEKYEIIQPKIATIENKTIATGTVEPRDEIMVKPQISGIVSEVLKKAGDKVVKGEIIAKVKVVPEMGQLNSAESRYEVAGIDLNQKKQDFDRQSLLYKKGIISKEEFDLAVATYKKAQEERSNAKDALDIVKNGITKKYADISNTQIRSTITGTILDVPVKAGNSVIQANTFNDGTTVASVANMSDMIFKGKLDETEVGRVRTGMPLTLTVGAIPDRKFNAVMEYIAPKGTNESGAVLFEIKAAAKIPQGVYVRAGYSANAEIVLQRAVNVWTIPESCVEFSNDKSYVYVVQIKNGKETYVKRYVKTGLSDGINIEIVSGLSGKDKIRGNMVDTKNKAEK